MSTVADPYSQWLGALATADPTEVGPPPSVTDMLSHLGGSDPRLEGLIRYLAIQEQASAEAEEEEEPDSELDTGSDVRDVLHRLYAEVSALRERNDHLAAALGACHLCWGAERSCPRCGGRGAPGSASPEPVPFATWVVPALRRVRAAQRGHRPAPDPATDSRTERSTDE